MTYAEMDLRQKCHRWILRLDRHYRRFESIHMNETTGLVTIKWRDIHDDLQVTEVMYGNMK